MGLYHVMGYWTYHFFPSIFLEGIIFLGSPFLHIVCYNVLITFKTIIMETFMHMNSEPHKMLLLHTCFKNHSHQIMKTH